MNKKTILALVFIFPMIVFLSACKKSCSAGSGGNVTLVLKPQHHGVPITGSTNYHDSAFVKFNATDFPGPDPSKYDIVVAGNSGDDFVNVTGLKCGQYFIMMTGFDTSAVWHIRVVGGLPVDFSETSGTKTYIVAVNE